jgi:hypothetical protein
MSKKRKKYLFITLILGLLFLVYWTFFTSHWASAIDEKTIWKFGFQSSNSSEVNVSNWFEPKSPLDINVSEEKKSVDVVFQSTFNLNSLDNLIEGRILTDYIQSVTVYFNGVKYGFFDESLINPSTRAENPEHVPIEEAWRPRKIELTQEDINKFLSKGTNTITLVFHNVEYLNPLSTTKKELQFLSSTYSNSLSWVIKPQWPKDKFSSTDLPLFRINTSGKAIPDEPKIKSELYIINNSNAQNSITEEGKRYNIKIERRGNTSQSFPKKSYTFSMRDKDFKKKSMSILELPKSKKWVLYGPYADKSLIRNALTYSMYTDMGNYAPRFQFVELVVNNNYQGIYMLTEKIRTGKNHLNIPKFKMDQTDSTKFEGGYIVDIDRYLHLGSTNYPPLEDTVSHPVCIQVYAPKKINTTARNLMHSQFDVFQKHLYERDNYYDYLDINSFVDYLIITEVTKNIDGYRLSTFLYNKNIADSIPKFYIGPIWDYNFALGMANYHNGYNPEGYVYNTDKFVPYWWNTLLSDSVFSSHLKTRYYELRRSVFTTEKLMSKIDSLSDICRGSTDHNFEKWSGLDSDPIWPNYYNGKTYQDEIDYLKNWLAKRLEFLDNGILGKTKKDAKFFEVIILNSKEWMKDIKVKAKERNISVEEMIKTDAQYMADQE